MSGSENPLLDDRDVEMILDELLDLGALAQLPYFAEHDRDTYELVLESARTLARDTLFPAYRALDVDPPRVEAGRVIVHPALRDLYARTQELGLVSAARPHAVGGAQLPLTVTALAAAYLMAANASVYGYIGLTAGAAHLIEAFGSEHLRATYMVKMYGGAWTGTMALTEPHAGSSLSDITTTAEPAPGATDGHYLVRVENGQLVDNDVAVTGLVHKIGWRGLPSVLLGYGERGDCHGWLVGEPHQGIKYMFQMMNEARIMVGLNGVATASVAYHEALAYARTRTQGRPQGNNVPGGRPRDPAAPPVAIIEHADVRRMLLRQKAIVEGGLALLVRASRYADLAHHAEEPARSAAQVLLDVLTPVAKSFPAERGYEANVLALQIHGGYGYSSEYLPEAWLRDQKLNSIHEGTTGIQAADLLGRRAIAKGGATLLALGGEILRACARARAAGVEATWIAEVERAMRVVGELTGELAKRGMTDPDAMLLHATDYLDLFGTVVIAWQWLELAAVAREALAGPLPRGRAARDAGYYEAKLAVAQYWIRTELPRIDHLARLCREGEDSYARLDPRAL